MSQKAGRKVQIKVPKRGKIRLVKMVAKNARMALEEEELSRERSTAYQRGCAGTAEGIELASLLAGSKAMIYRTCRGRTQGAMVS